MTIASSSVSNGEPIVQLQQSAAAGNLVAVIGTGSSTALTNGKFPALSWKGLIEDGFAYGAKKGKITEDQAKLWKGQLDSSDLDDLLSAAEFMGRKLDAPKGDLYARWLEGVFKDVRPENDKMEKALRALEAAGVPLCTLNYDSLIERVTGLKPINMIDTSKVTAWMRRDTFDVAHRRRAARPMSRGRGRSFAGLVDRGVAGSGPICTGLRSPRTQLASVESWSVRRRALAPDLVALRTHALERGNMAYYYSHDAVCFSQARYLLEQ